MKRTRILLIVTIMCLSFSGCRMVANKEIFLSSTETEVTMDGAAGQEEVEVKKEDEQEMIRFFDFETKTVTLNSGYEMPINGLGTYSLLNQEGVDSVTQR